MNKTKHYSSARSLLTRVVAAGAVFVSRFVKLAPNFSLVGSFGFFNSNLPVFFAQILAFDLFVSGLYPGIYFNYLGFLSYWIMGRLAAGKKRRQLVFLPLASCLFFLLSNFGVWWYWYPRTLEGLLNCYILAIPFFRNTLLGDLFFGGIILFMPNSVLLLGSLFKRQRTYATSTSI